MNKRYLIIGTSAAAVGAVQKLRTLDPEGHIILFSSEYEQPYNKCLLADYAAGQKKEEDIYTLSKIVSPHITIHKGARVTSIIPEAKHIIVENGTNEPYDYLLLGMGSSPAMPPLFQIKATNLFFFHTLHHINYLLNYIQSHNSKTAVIIGAGLSGLECADVLVKRGIAVTIIEKNNQVLSSLMPVNAARVVEHAMHKTNIQLLLNTQVMALEQEGDLIKGIATQNNPAIVADLIIVATGLTPNSQLAQDAGLACYQHSVLVDDYLQTSDTAIFAAGDLIVAKHQRTGALVRSTTWPDAMMQGGYAAHAMAGQPKAYPGVMPIASSAFFGVQVVSAGSLGHKSDSYQEMSTGGHFGGYFYEKGKILAGFVMVGSSLNWVAARRALLTRQEYGAFT